MKHLASALVRIVMSFCLTALLGWSYAASHEPALRSPVLSTRSTWREGEKPGTRPDTRPKLKVGTSQGPEVGAGLGGPLTPSLSPDGGEGETHRAPRVDLRAARDSMPGHEYQLAIRMLGCGGISNGVPAKAGQLITIQITVVPQEAKKLDLVLVPGSGLVKAFLMGRFEITQAQYEGVTSNNPSRFKNGPDYPVETVSWTDAKQFCERLNSGLPDEAKGKLTFRLPTDEEWSLAVGLLPETGNTPAEKDGRIKEEYPWGQQWPPPPGSGNYADEATARKYGKNWEIITGYDDGYAETAPVGSYRPNKHGLYDLGGNVWEWCEDWYDSDQKQRTLRGASWNLGSSHYLLSSIRDLRAPDFRHYRYGFRVVLARVTN